MKRFIELTNGFTRRNELVNLDNVIRFERMGDNRARIYLVDGSEITTVEKYEEIFSVLNRCDDVCNG